MTMCQIMTIPQATQLPRVKASLTIKMNGESCDMKNNLSDAIITMKRQQLTRMIDSQGCIEITILQRNSCLSLVSHLT